MSDRDKCLGKIEGVHQEFIEFDYWNGTDFETAREFVEKHLDEPQEGQSYTVYLVNGYGYRFKFAFRPRLVVDWGELSEEVYHLPPSTGAPRAYGFQSPPKPPVEFLREESGREWP